MRLKIRATSLLSLALPLMVNGLQTERFVRTLLRRFFHKPGPRYLFAVAAVACAFALRIWLIPLTGTGAPFVLFFAAILVTALFAGVGPVIFAVLLSAPLAAHTFVVRAGYTIFQAVFQSVLYGIDGLVVCYLT